MRDSREAYIASGCNMAFFSGNVCYWQVRTEDDGRALVDDPLFQAGLLHAFPCSNSITSSADPWFRLGWGGRLTIHRPEH
jgi:hypothetical protein